MATVLNISINDLSAQFIQDLRASFDTKTKVEIKVQESKHGKGLFSDAQFWQIIKQLDWSKKEYSDIIAPAVLALSQMPMPCIYLFKDFLSEKLYRLDTRQHASVYLKKEGEDLLSADDFLYARCAVVAEGKDFYQKTLKNADEMPSEIAFEPLLNIANEAYKIKTNKNLDYIPSFNYETKSNKLAW
jgi:hypothetical protein